MQVIGHLHDPSALCLFKKSLDARLAAESGRGWGEDRRSSARPKLRLCYFSGRQVRISERALSLFLLDLYQDSESTGQVAEQRIAAPVSNSIIPDSDWVTGWKVKGFVFRFPIRTSILKRVWKIALGTSVCLSACKTLAPTRRIFMKIDIWGFFENLARKFSFVYNLTRITVTLHEHPCEFMTISGCFFYNEKYFRKKL